MESEPSLFDRLGGTRRIARDLGEPPSTVQGWKRQRRVPAKKQGQFLRRYAELGIDVTAEDVMFPFPEDRELR